VAEPARTAPARSVVSPITIVTVPATPGLRFRLLRKVYVTDHRGRTTIPAADLVRMRAATADPSGLTKSLRLLPAAAAPHGGKYYTLERWYGCTVCVGLERRRSKLSAAIAVFQQVRFVFEDRTGRPVDLGMVDEMVMKRIDGSVMTFRGKRLETPVLLQASRVVPLNHALVSKDLLYRIQRVMIGGNNAVNRAQQAFLPAKTRRVRIQLLFYSTRFRAQDAFFGFPIGSGIRLEYPNGHVEERRFGENAEVTIPALPRGDYRVKVEAPGFSPYIPISITRDQEASLEVLSYFDVAVLVVGVGGVTVALLVARRPRLRRRLLRFGFHAM
jgi:hypothetical protein